jgi:hypothetical protein
MAKFTIQVTGVTNFRAALRAFDDEQKKELKAVHLKAAMLVYNSAAIRVPVRTGKLKSTLRPAATATYAAVRIGGKRSAPYAGPIHFGWPSRPAPQRGWRGGPIQPSPFLYDAFDKRRGEVEDAFFRFMVKAAKKAGF